MEGLKSPHDLLCVIKYLFGLDLSGEEKSNRGKM